MAQILCHIPDEARRGQIAGFCEKRKVAFRRLTAADGDSTLGGLLGMPMVPAGKKAPALWRMPEMLIFCGFGDKELDDFLAAWRRAGILPVALKAVVTPYNIGWSLYELAAELEKEHREMTGQG